MLNSSAGIIAASRAATQSGSGSLRWIGAITTASIFRMQSSSRMVHLRPSRVRVGRFALPVRPTPELPQAELRLTHNLDDETGESGYDGGLSLADREFDRLGGPRSAAPVHRDARRAQASPPLGLTSLAGTARQGRWERTSVAWQLS